MSLGFLVSGAFSELLSIPGFILAIAVLQIVVIVYLAIAVKNDAEMRSASGDLFLVGPWMWFLMVLMTGGYPGTIGYWIIHYSSLRNRR